MLRHATIPLARGWNSWSALPAEMVFLPLATAASRSPISPPPPAPV